MKYQEGLNLKVLIIIQIKPSKNLLNFSNCFSPVFFNKLYFSMYAWIAQSWHKIFSTPNTLMHAACWIQLVILYGYTFSLYMIIL